ncbi:polyprenyl diphosphate synthase [Streptomyces coeruleorubidus]|uniref:polyprenyl diphosphate synthase n=1 Tax=Streptomyces coeruleorubidus TaxID=116188 RepID=UPI0036814B1D
MRPSPLHPARVYRRSGIHDPVLRRGYEACRRATRARGEIEYAVSLLLPPPLRIATWALYGAGVTVDCLADTAQPSDTKDAGRAERLEAWISAFDADLRDGRSSDPVRQALIHTMLTWNLPPGFMHTQFEQLRLDVHGRRFTTWQEWRGYNSLVTTPFMLRAASLMMRVAGLSAEPEAIASGVPEAAVAWQMATDAIILTDALVDLSEDLDDGHVPLPQEALDEAGVRRADLLTRRSTPAFEELVRHLADRARGWLDRTPVPPVLHPSVGIALGAYTDLYRLRLRAAADTPAALLHRRPALPGSARQRVLLSARARAALAWTLFPLPVRPCPPPEPACPPAGLTGADEGRPLTAEARAAERRPVVPPAPHPSGVRPPLLPDGAVPRHVAIVMDGNGRWATARGLPRTEGHRAGADALVDVVHGALEIGLKYLTVYAFSTENWKRPADELHALMHETPRQLRRITDDAEPLDVRVRWAGLRSGLPADVIEALVEAEQGTRDRTGLTLTVCLNYGGRAEITAAAAHLAQEAVAGRIDPASVSEHAFARHLHVPELPDVDLLLRTGGDQRTSNFLPWQATYAELLFLDTPWPEVDRRDLWAAIEQYARRTRRYGSIPRIPAQARPAHRR